MKLGIHRARWHLRAQRSERQEKGMRAGLAFRWHLFWDFCRAGPSPGFKSCLSDHNRGNVGKRGRQGGGPGSLDKLAHTRQMFAQKNTVKSSCKYNRNLLSHTAGSACFLLSALPIWCEEELGGQVSGIEGGLLCISMLAPSSLLPRRTVLPLQMSPPSDPWAWSVPQVGVREELS